MAGSLLEEIMEGGGNYDFAKGLMPGHVRDEGKMVIEGRVIFYQSRFRRVALPIVYDATALDSATGITASAENFGDAQDAYKTAVANLLVILRQRGLMKGSKEPDPAADEKLVPGPESHPEEKPIQSGASVQNQDIGGTRNDQDQQNEPSGMLLEVTPDYQGSYAAYTMKQANPTADMLSPRDTYKLWSHCKGIAFILNNATFDLTERKGSDIDMDNMVHLFKELGYIINLHKDQTGQEIKDSIQSFAAMFNQEGASYDSAVVVLMSHGDTGVIHGTDRVPVKLGDLRRELEGDRCPGLIGKPKMYFIQACRGKNFTSTLPVVPDGLSSHWAGGESSLISPDGFLHVQPDNLLDVADVHFAYASIDGHLSLRSEAIGCFFVQALCEVFFANAHHDNLDTLMNKVTDRVNRMKGTFYDHVSGKWIPVNQTPECVKSMRKALYFLPKYSKKK